MKICPYCHEPIDEQHSVAMLNFAEWIGCPKYPKNENPTFVNKELFVKKRARNA